jgi:hypothetical protein
MDEKEKEKQEILRRVVKVADEIRGQTLKLIQKEIAQIEANALNELEEAGIILFEEEKKIFLKDVKEEIVEKLWRSLRK